MGDAEMILESTPDAGCGLSKADYATPDAGPIAALELRIRGEVTNIHMQIIDEATFRIGSDVFTRKNVLAQVDGMVKVSLYLDGAQRPFAERGYCLQQFPFIAGMPEPQRSRELIARALVSMPSQALYGLAQGQRSMLEAYSRQQGGYDLAPAGGLEFVLRKKD